MSDGRRFDRIIAIPLFDDVWAPHMARGIEPAPRLPECPLGGKWRLVSGVDKVVGSCVACPEPVCVRSGKTRGRKKRALTPLIGDWDEPPWMPKGDCCATCLQGEYVDAGGIHGLRRHCRYGTQDIISWERAARRGSMLCVNAGRSEYERWDA